MIEWMDLFFLANPVKTWLAALGAMIAAFGGLWILKGLLLNRLERLALRTKPTLDDLLTAFVKKTHALFLLLIAMRFGSQWLTIPDETQDLLGRLLLFGVLFQIGLWGDELINHVIRRNVAHDHPARGTSTTTLDALSIVGKVVLWIVVGLIALDNLPNVEVNSLIASLGIGGVAAALAVQNILGDLFASISIALDKPFEIGDFLILDSDMGNVERIGIRSTRIRSLSGEQLIVSNTDLLNSRIRNYKRMQERRIQFAFGVVYETTHDQLQRIPDLVREVVGREERARFDRAHFKSFGDFSLDFEVVYHVLSEDYAAYMDLQQSINLGLFQRFEEEGIEFAYPTQMIYWKNSAAS